MLQCECVQRDDSGGGAGAVDEITVDVVGVDGHDKDSDYDAKSKPMPGWYDTVQLLLVLLAPVFQT